MEHKKTILKSAGQISGATFLSRILGLLRDVLTAAVFGAGMVWDAFVVAWTIPNLFRRLFGEGALTAAFVPVFTDSLVHEEREKSWRLASTVITVLVFTLTMFVISIDLILWLVSILVPLSDKISLTFSLTQLLLPYMVLICSVALFMGILNSLNHFLMPALAPAVLNIVLILFLLIVLPFFKTSQISQIYILACGILLGGIIQILMQFPVLKSKGFKYSFSLNIKLPDFKKILTLMGPSVIGLAVFQINVVVDRILALILRPGAASVLFYSNRLVQLPLAIFGISLATAVLPVMSKSISTNNNEQFRSTIIHGIKILMVIIIPASAGLAILGIPIIQLIFQRGAFSYNDAVRTGIALGCYSSGLFAFATQKIVVQGFYARKDMITPVKIGAFCVLLNLILNIALMFPLKEAGLALATSITSYVNVIILFRILSKKIISFSISEFYITFKKVFSATAIMSILCGISLMFISKLFPVDNLLIKLLKVFIPILLSVFCVLITYHLIKLKEFTEIIKLFLEKLKKN